MKVTGRCRKSMRAAVGLAAAASMTFFSSGAALAQAPAAPQATPAQQAEAIAEPSVVFIQTGWTGWLMNGPLSELLSSDGTSAPKFTVTTSCTGFIANPDGYILTAGHCVDNTSMQYGGKGLIIQAAVLEAVDEGYVSSSNAAALITYGYANWRVEGHESGSLPDRIVGVFPTKAASGIEVSKGIEATVTDFKAFNEGDVALLKVQTDTPMPALEVAPTSPADGTLVVALGYPGSVSDSVDTNNDPSMKDGTISGSRTVGGVPFTEISAATSPGMSGGPVVDSAGRVVGTVSWSPGAETQAFNFVTATSAVHEMLSSHSVSNTLSATDRTYRAGLADYFAGRYHASAKDFNQVLALEPDHAMAQQYLRLATTNFPNEKTGGSGNTLMFVLIGVGALVLLGGGGWFFLARKRRGRGPVGVPPAAAPPFTGPPAVPATYAGLPPVTTPYPGPPNVYPIASGAPGELVETGGPFDAEPTVTIGSGSSAQVADQSAAEPVSHYCPLCGTPHEAQAHFCESCGFHFPARVAHGDGSARY